MLSFKKYSPVILAAAAVGLSLPVALAEKPTYEQLEAKVSKLEQRLDQVETN